MFNFHCNHQQVVCKKCSSIIITLSTNRLQKIFESKKNFDRHFNKLILSKIVVVLTFQLKNYFHAKHQSYLNKFIDEIRRFIQRIIINRLRFLSSNQLIKRSKSTHFFIVILIRVIIE